MDTTNMGVKALLNWLNSLKLAERELHVEDLRDGMFFVQVVYKLKKQEIQPVSQSVEERAQLINDFLERDCRFSPSRGTTLSWGNIRDGINLPIEISKVLLLLVYHDMMNDRCTLNQLEYEAELEIATLTDHFVFESDGCVFLSDNVEAYLQRKYLSCPTIKSEDGTISSRSSSSMSSIPDFSDDSPVFHRSQKVQFVGLQTVTSPLVRGSPLQNIMNTPQFQMRRMQRQMVQEREYRDGLEAELACKLSLIAQRESCISQLQYRLDKMKEDQGDQEHVAMEQFQELETKNNSLQSRLHELLKLNQDLKCNTSHMERKLDELTEENGTLSVQIRDVSSQLAISTAEIGRLTENQVSAYQEWCIKMETMQSELQQATAQKEILCEQMEILQSKILSLEDQLSFANNEERGENMGPVMEVERSAELFQEIQGLKKQNINLHSSLRKAEDDVKIKEELLAKQQQDGSKIQEELQGRIISFQEEVVNLQNEVRDLQTRLENMSAFITAAEKEIEAKEEELAKTRQVANDERALLRNQLDVSAKEMEKMKELQREDEKHHVKLKEKMHTLQSELSIVNAASEDKDQQLNRLREEVAVQEETVREAKQLIKAKEEMQTKLEKESIHLEAVRQRELHDLKGQVGSLNISLKKAEEEFQVKQDLLTNNQHESNIQREALEKQMSASQDEVRKLTEVIRAKEEQLILLKEENLRQSETLQREMAELKQHIENMDIILKKAEDRVQAKEDLLAKAEQEVQIKEELLAKQQQEVSKLQEAMQEKISVFQKEVKDLQAQLENTSASIKLADEEIKAKKEELAKSRQEAKEEKDRLQKQLSASEEEMKKLNDLHKEKAIYLQQVEEKMQNLQTELSIVNAASEDKDQQLNRLREDVAVQEELVREAKQSFKAKEEMQVKLEKESLHMKEVLQHELHGLKGQVESLNISLGKAEEEIQVKQDLLTNNQHESNMQREELEEQMSASQDEVRKLTEEIRAKEEQLILLKEENLTQSETLQREMADLKQHIENMNIILKKAEDRVQAKEDLLAKSQQEVQIKEELLAKQLQESSKLQEAMQGKINVFKKEVKDLQAQLENTSASIKLADEEIKAKEQELAKSRQEAKEEKDRLQEQLSASEEEIKKLNDLHREKAIYLQQVEEKMQNLQTELSIVNAASEDKDKQLTRLREEVAVQEETIRETKEMIKAKEEMHAKLEKESIHLEEVRQRELHDLKGQAESLNISLKKAEEEFKVKQDLLTNNQHESNMQREELEEQMSASQDEVRKLTEELGAKEEQLVLLKEEILTQSETLQSEIENLKKRVEYLNEIHKMARDHAQAKEDLLAKSEDDNRRQREALEAVQKDFGREKEALVQENTALVGRLFEAEQNQTILQKQLELMGSEKDRLQQVMERDCKVSLKLEMALRQELSSLKMANEKLLENDGHELEGLQKRLIAKTEAAEHYKAQMEKAASHYNSKKQLLQESQEQAVELQRSLELKGHELTAATAEVALLQLELQKAHGTERDLKTRVASLEAQLAFADRNLREQSRIRGTAIETVHHHDSGKKATLTAQATVVKPELSTDSFEHSSLDDSLNVTRRQLAPEESSTPMVRSSERLAAKRHALEAESLESLYFTPMNHRQLKRNCMDSDKRNPSSSVKRRRTTQVINITMTKKTPGPEMESRADDSFYSLAPARSQPNLTDRHATARPISMEIFGAPRMAGALSDQLLGLPGYRRSTNLVNPRSTSTFCVGSSENEPDTGEDWMRIAELQARNKTCLPHLKSSYPLESRPSLGPAFCITDDDLRLGDPTDTIRRASTMPGQFHDSLSSHRLSLMVGQAVSAADAHPHRHSLMPGQIPALPPRLHSPRGSKRASAAQVQKVASPETKMKASCFALPHTPRKKNIGPSGSQIHTALSPVQNREPVMFVFENTPKKRGYLQRGMNKLRNSARKSPGKDLRKPPAAEATTQKSASSMQPRTSRPTGGRSSKDGSGRSPHVVDNTSRKSTKAGSTAKSPGLTASARKIINSRMKF